MTLKEQLTFKEHQEIQDLVDAIVTTAKLLKYQVSGQFGVDVTYFTVNEQDNEIPFIAFLIIYKRLNPLDTVKIETKYDGIKITLENESHLIKINHLQNLLQKL